MWKKQKLMWMVMLVMVVIIILLVTLMSVTTAQAQTPIDLLLEQVVNMVLDLRDRVIVLEGLHGIDPYPGPGEECDTMMCQDGYLKHIGPDNTPTPFFVGTAMPAPTQRPENINHPVPTVPTDYVYLPTPTGAPDDTCYFHPEDCDFVNLPVVFGK